MKIWENSVMMAWNQSEEKPIIINENGIETMIMINNERLMANEEY